MYKCFMSCSLMNICICLSVCYRQLAQSMQVASIYHFGAASLMGFPTTFRMVAAGSIHQSHVG